MTIARELAEFLTGTSVTTSQIKRSRTRRC